jgi:hypothetical protein
MWRRVLMSRGGTANTTQRYQDLWDYRIFRINRGTSIRICRTGELAE